MNKLEEMRIKIDEIDTEIIKLYEQRMDAVKEIIDFKIDNNMAIVDSNREEKMLVTNLEKIKNEVYKVYYADVLKGFLSSSKRFQNDILETKKW